MHDVIASATKITVVTNDKQLFVAKVSNCLSTKKTTLSSMGIGATFSPPAVIIISFILPVIVRKLFLSNLPISPECNQPSENFKTSQIISKSYPEIFISKLLK